MRCRNPFVKLRGGKMTKDNVVSIIPYQRLGKKYGKLLGDACQDYVLEGEIKRLFDLNKHRIISAGELKGMCEDSVRRMVNGGVSPRYVRELEGLIEQHERTQKNGLTFIDEEGEDVVCLGAKYDQLSVKKYLLH